MMDSERIPRSSSFQRIRSRSKAGGFDLPPERSYSRAGSACSSYSGANISPMRSPMPAYRGKLVSFPGDENEQPYTAGQPTPLQFGKREERPDYHTSTLDSALKNPRTVSTAVPSQYHETPSYTSFKSKGILVDSPRHQHNSRGGGGLLSPGGAAQTLNGRSTTPPPAGGRNRAASTSVTPRRRRAKEKRQEAEQNFAFYDDSFVEEFVLTAKEEMNTKERAANQRHVDTEVEDKTSKAGSILAKEKERLRSGQHRSSSRRHGHRHAHTSDESYSPYDDDSVEVRSNTSRQSERHRRRAAKEVASQRSSRHASEEDDPEEEYRALENARRSASKKPSVAQLKRTRSPSSSDDNGGHRSNDDDGSYTSSVSEDFTDAKGKKCHRRYRRHHHSRSRNASPERMTTTTTAAAPSSILATATDAMKPARRRGPRRESVVAFADEYASVGNDRPIRGAGRSPSLHSNDGDAPVVLGRKPRAAAKKAESEEPTELLGRLQSVERPVLLGRSRRAVDLMQQEVAHRNNVIAASAVPRQRARRGTAAAVRAAAAQDNDFLGSVDASTPARQQLSHHAQVTAQASRHTAVKSSAPNPNDPMAVFFESAFPTPSRFDEMAGMASAPPMGRKRNNGNFPLMLPTTIAKASRK